ncbi:hypothetical protein KRP22_006632 [Phytophthora ramorum]|uniref:Arginine--tRNA ligase, chloroplastic/mitochondrial n=1 Tax=Phytophthora ramorum TaxID=164328 RepID=UPI0030A9068F|nr:Arginine--tRNA ligase, chloroplastic/mitochondrial [Phytophthora ramorum]KAH7507134.1 Arginine--tRNA ligase, chloroplastic/mitochondrial [Phytophthora ramorum]
MAVTRSTLSCTWHVQRLLRRSLRSSLPSVDVAALPAASLGVRRSAQSDADYQTSLALQLGSRPSKKKKQETFGVTPEELANSIVDNLPTVEHQKCPLLKDAFVTNGGFVNLVLHDEWVARQALAMATDGIKPTQLPEDQQKDIIVDFAAPNMGKKLHVGHLRSSVLGDTICNLLEFRGHRVARVSHTGDVGSALATLIVEIMEQQVPLETLTDAQLGACYEAGKRKLGGQIDTAFKHKVDNVVLQLQQLGSDDAVDPKVRETWTRACQVSREAYQRIFDRLRVNVTERGESTYMPLVPAAVAKMEESGLAVTSQGALGIFLDGPDKPPMLIRKSDGGFLYATVDLACLHSRIHGFPGVDSTQYDEVVYVTDQSQQLHFQHLFAAARKAGWTNRPGKEDVKLTHAPFGLVLGHDGTKLSSRNGAFDYLEDLLDGAAAECSRQALASATTGVVVNELSLTQKQVDAQNRVVGDAAVRYFELAQQRERNYKFIMSNVLNLKGNTGVYLMYASARLQGILRKASGLNGDQTSWDALLGLSSDSSAAQDVLALASADWHPSERALALLLAQFDDEVAATLAHLYPHYLCDYLFRVAGHFHGFYENCRVLHDPRQDSRLLLCAATNAVLRRGLQLVGVEAVDRM